MQLSSNNWRDIQKYYEHCYTKFRETGDEIFLIRRVSPSLIEGIGEDKTPLNCFLHNEEDQEPYLLDYILPKKSFFEFDGKACLLNRIPARQYKRGLCSENTQILSLGADGGFSKLNIDFPVLKAYIQKQSFRSFAEAKELPSVALSPRIALTMSGFIFVDAVKIGHYDFVSKTITTKHKSFKPELEEILQRTHEVISFVFK